MSAGTIFVIFGVIAALLFFRAGAIAIMPALDRLTASVSAATTALAAATAAAGSGTGAPSDDAALNALADSLDSAVSAYNAATAPKGDDTAVATEGNDSIEGSGGNPLAPSN